MSLLEIYNESIRDLLGSNPVNSLEIKQGKEGVHVPGLEEVEVENVEDVHRVKLLNFYKYVYIKYENLHTNEVLDNITKDDDLGSKNP